VTATGHVEKIEDVDKKRKAKLEMLYKAKRNL
jgi:hypothetical protein